jgi:ATP synthase protein I
MSIHTLKIKVQHQAYQLVWLQLTGVTALALIALFIAGQQSSFSILLGGLCYVLPNLIFVWRVFRYVGASQMMMFMAAFFMGEMLKLVMSAFLVLMIVNYLSVSLSSVIIGFMGAIVSFWIACFWYFSRKVGVTR